MQPKVVGEVVQSPAERRAALETGAGTAPALQRPEVRRCGRE